MTPDLWVSIFRFQSFPWFHGCKPLYHVNLINPFHQWIWFNILPSRKNCEFTNSFDIFLSIEKILRFRYTWISPSKQNLNFVVWVQRFSILFLCYCFPSFTSLLVLGIIIFDWICFGLNPICRRWLFDMALELCLLFILFFSSILFWCS